MSLERRVAKLEDDLTYLRAIVDGSEMQTREAAAYLVGIVTRYLHGKGVIDEKALARYVAKFAGDPANHEDYMGFMVRLFESQLDYHRRHAADFALPCSPGVGDPEP